MNKSDFIVCKTRCEHEFKVAVSDDVGFYSHWENGFYIVDVVFALYSWFLSFRLWCFVLSCFF